MQISVNLTYLNGIKMTTIQQSITNTFLTKEFHHCFLHARWDGLVVVDILNFAFIYLFIYSFIFCFAFVSCLFFLMLILVSLCVII